MSAPLVRRNDPGGTPARVLLVDDDAFVREIMAISLREMGLEITEAPSGTRAVEMLREGPDRFDALVTDVTLPGGVTGINVAATMRALRPDVPIVLMSGDIDALVSPAAHDVRTIAKPFLAADLFRLLGQTADRSRF